MRPWRRPRPRPTDPRAAPRGAGEGSGRPADAATRGARGEAAAAALLRRAGLRVEARNLRTRAGELDLLARRGRLWVAVEVKARSRHPAPELLVDDAVLARLEHALRALAPHLRPRPRALRVDVVAVRLTEDGRVAGEPLHLPGPQLPA